MFDAKVSNLANAIDPATGAMLIQLVVDNSDGKLKPGGYAEVTFDTGDAAGTGLHIPSSALLFRKEGTAVAVVEDGNKVAIKPVKIGRDYGSELEVVAGLTAQDRVIDSPSDAITTGQIVKPVAKPVEAPQKS